MTGAETDLVGRVGQGERSAEVMRLALKVPMYRLGTYLLSATHRPGGVGYSSNVNQASASTPQ